MRNCDPSPSHQSLRRRAVDGLSFLEREGTGEPVVFLHGIGSNSESFGPVLQAFPYDPWLIAWDAPGYLASTPLTDVSPSVGAYCDALTRLLDGLELPNVHLVGHSLGTLIAAAFAGSAPDRVKSLTLASSAQGYGIAAGQALPESGAKRLEDLNDLGPERFAKERAERLVFQPEKNGGAVARVRQEMARINPRGYAQAVHMLATGDLAGFVAKAKICPGFIIGAEDIVTPMRQTENARRAWMAQNGRTPPCIVIPNAGHAVYVQAQTQFIEALLTLVPALSPATHGHATGG